MTVTYDGDLSTDLEKLRFYTGDTVSGSGPRPGDRNFTDAELNPLITLEGSWEKAVAAVFEALTAEWASQPDIRVGPRSESRSQPAKEFRKKAEEWRAAYGGGLTARMISVGVNRADGYSVDIPSDAVENPGTEYT